MTKKDISEKKKENLKERAKRNAVEFKKEFNKLMTTTFIGAFGFLIALVWRDLISAWINKISESSPIQGKLFSAMIVTLICFLGIFFITKFFSEKNEK